MGKKEPHFCENCGTPMSWDSHFKKYECTKCGHMKEVSTMTEYGWKVEEMSDDVLQAQIEQFQVASESTEPWLIPPGCAREVLAMLRELKARREKLHP